MRFTIIIVLGVILLSCGGKKAPKNLIPEDQLHDLLVDLHLLDAISTDHSINIVSGDIDSLTLYTSLFHKYGTDKETFDATITWYSSHPELLSELYDKVFGTINKNHQTYSDQVDLFNRGSSNIKNIFKTTKYIDTRGVDLDYPTPFVFETDSLGTYLFDIRLRLFNDDESLNPRISAYFMDKKTDATDSLLIINTPIIKSSHSRDYQFISELEDSTYKYVKLIVPRVESQTVDYRKNLQLSSIRVNKLKNAAALESKAKKKLTPDDIKKK